VISQTTLTRIKDAINRFPELMGCRIGFHGNLRSAMVDKGNSGSPNYKIIIIIEESEADLGLDFIPRRTPIQLPEPQKKLNKTVVGAELRGAALNCTFAAVTAATMAGSAVAEVPSGGLSTVLLVASWTGLITQSIQCGNGIARVVEAYNNPDDNSLERAEKDRFDPNSDSTYTKIMDLVDIAGLVSVLPGTATAAISIRKMLMLRGALPAEELMMKMTNAQKIEAYQNAAMRVSKNPSAKAEFYEILKSLGKRTISRMEQGNEIIIKRSMVAAGKLVSEHTLRELTKNTREILITSLELTVNAMPKEYVGSASGFLNKALDKTRNIIINIITER
jgi:hypothetical protein